ncbi:4Fe-4S ferredoxin iron-sulfur binding domain protein [Desulfobulbus propionicus DSM 2032]|uniref:4Fe-4S ferredoxin iron-sulfur binding domain protein n=1 Tax=Desulfobulbus propionicus (strain ATCC 33891 / DSM 2032 / VKM B-1956 / 1pr3) TaxID=577650 RepID=A0A7U3YK04_DESPD|nr:4Fe-4S dicluster domain-containing protein [Desulfobulbus propionicus]ADW16802.1 4Fe-4S ferredoxin iron-sulfur binding domain protein [Desulfobulbus propionicus DSM 2032]
MKTLINRRRFLRGSLAASAAATVSLAKKTDAATFEGYPDAMGVLVDLSRCVGCRSCEAACNKEQHLPAPEKPFNDFSVFDELHHGQKRRTDETRYTVVNRYDIPGSEHPLFRKIQCNHCLEPACLTSCFVNAYTKTPEGAVVYDPSVCVGCRTCMIACPFYIPTFRYSSAFKPRIMKCVFCHDTRLTKGLPPACVEACPQEALTFGRRSDLVAMGTQRIRENPGAYVDHIYGEHEAGGTSWMYLSPAPFDQVGMDTSVPKEPILNYVKDFLSIVPMVLTIWPALFAGFNLLATRKDTMEQQKNNNEGEV